MPCMLCGHRGRELLVVGYDRQFARAEDYPYVRCAGCGLVGLEPLPEPAAIARFYPPAYYDQLESTGRNLDKPINQLAVRYYYGVESAGRSRWARALFSVLSGRILRGLMTPWGSNRLLDVGCGTGAALDIYRRLGWTVAGIDASADAVARARARGMSVHLGDVFDAPFGSEFDVVLLSHVIEHVRDPVAVLKRTAAFVAPGGKVVVLTPNARSLGFHRYRSCWYALDAPRHLFLFDPRTLERLAHAAGLVATRIITTTEPTVLCYSRHYAVTQGQVLPTGLAARETILRASAERRQRHRLYREVVTPLGWVAARLGKGEVLEAELQRSGP